MVQVRGIHVTVMDERKLPVAAKIACHDRRVFTGFFCQTESPEYEPASRRPKNRSRSGADRWPTRVDELCRPVDDIDADRFFRKFIEKGDGA